MAANLKVRLLRASFGAVPALEIDRDGTRLVKSFGVGMFNFPHGLFVDSDGNVWVSDAQGEDGKNPKSTGKGHQKRVVG